MKISLTILLVVIAILVLWTLWGYFSSRVEQAQYTVIKVANGYEIRTYAAHIEAQTIVDGSYDDALRKGFSIVAGYIFGGNVKKESIAMTAPVREQPTSEKVAMTAPVLATTHGDARVIAFVMPQSYTLESLPTPSDSRVKLVEVPVKNMAVLRFSWFRGADRIKKMEEQLLSDLARDGVDVLGLPSYAGYNAPGTPPWMARNEVMVEVR